LTQIEAFAAPRKFSAALFPNFMLQCVKSPTREDWPMIRIERGIEVSPGIWEYTVPSLGIAGRSRQPLLDACRQIKRAGGSTATHAGVFRERSTEADISCPVGIGADYTVSETNTLKPRFRKFQEFVGIAMREAA
jgi:hypothetical protein